MSAVRFTTQTRTATYKEAEKEAFDRAVSFYGKGTEFSTVSIHGRTAEDEDTQLMVVVTDWMFST